MSIHESEYDSDEEFRPRLISKKPGCTIDHVSPGIVIKRGYRVTCNEEAALRLVRGTCWAPVPIVHMATHKWDRLPHGTLVMDFVRGTKLSEFWGHLKNDGNDDDTKRSICDNIWTFVMELRQVPRPATFRPYLVSCFQCGADGSLSEDVLLKDLHDPASILPTDEALRARIEERYLHYNGGSYGQDLSSFLPRSEVSVFTHGDLTPRNIMINDTGRITGILDWRNSGWYPDYWEFANMMKPGVDQDWMDWMDRTKPVEWDITGIKMARRVLF